MSWSRLVIAAGLSERWDGEVDPQVTSIVEDSRAASPGGCFVAVRGTSLDGHAYIDAAIERGATAIVCERAVQVPPHVAVARVPSARGAAGRLACALHGLNDVLSAGRLKIVGITGTNGKSTFCYLARSILREAGAPTALLGTVQYDLLARKIEASMTTPPATELVGYLAEASAAGATHAVMEVSSHALDQGRCDGLRFAVGVFSNLSGDHLDYHRDMESYLVAKKRLFDGLDAEAVAAVNRDDPAGERMLADCGARIIRYGIEGAHATVGNGSRPSAMDVTARIVEQTARGTRFELRLRAGASTPLAYRGPDVCEAFTPLIGRHNVQNCLAAISAGLGLGLPVEAIVRGVEAVRVVPGRLHRVAWPTSNGSADERFSVFVDYAHTDDALDNVLSALKPFAASGRLIVLFGCGGDRDGTKRPRMAKAAARWADEIVLTSDNPRTEDPARIIDEVIAGFTPADLPRVRVEHDRRRAIEAALRLARPGDIVLLAGKGHETYQIIGKERLPFDDAAVAAEVLRTPGLLDVTCAE